MSQNVSKKNRPSQRLAKADLIERLQNRYEKELGVEASQDTLTQMFNIMMDEVKGSLRRGKGIQLNGFGLFYGKKMKSRKVVANFEGEAKTYRVPAHTKLGFTSYFSADEDIKRTNRR